MLPRILPVAFVTSLMYACAPATESTAVLDTLAIDSVSAPTPKAPGNFQFSSDELFTTPLPVDVTDSADLQKYFPVTRYVDGIDNEDGTPWYRYCSYANADVTVSFYDFFDSDPRRIYYFEFASSDPFMKFAAGIHVGMTRQEFIDALKLEGPEAATASSYSALQIGGSHQVYFTFADEKLARVRYDFDYEGTIPNTISSLVDRWEEVTENEAEGQVELWKPCEMHTYELQEIEMGETTKYVLMIGNVQDAQIDSVIWIRKTATGFVINSMNQNGSGEPFKRRVDFTRDDWSLAEWQGELFANSATAQSAYQEKCDGEEP